MRDGVEVLGQIGIHDVRVSATEQSVYRLDGVTRLHGSLRIDLREFGVKLPSYLGVAVAPEVDIEVELTAILG